MAATARQLYRYHAANAGAVAKSMKQVRRSANRAAKTGDDALAEILTRLYALLLAAQIENRLKQLSYEPPLTEEDRRRIRPTGKSQTEQWLAAIDWGFQRQYRPTGGVNKLPFTPAAHRNALREIVTADLAPVIELRNALGHGQWAYVLNHDETDANSQAMRILKQETMLTLAYKEVILKRLYRVMTDLLVAPTKAFPRDFDEHYKAVAYARRQLASADWNAHLAHLKHRHAVGQQRRTSDGPA